MQKGCHTSQLSRIRQRLPATDLSGTNPFVVSLTPRSNMTVVDKVALRPRLFSSAAMSDLAPSLG